MCHRRPDRNTEKAGPFLGFGIVPARINKFMLPKSIQTHTMGRQGPVCAKKVTWQAACGRILRVDPGRTVTPPGQHHRLIKHPVQIDWCCYWHCNYAIVPGIGKGSQLSELRQSDTRFTTIPGTRRRAGRKPTHKSDQSRMPQGGTQTNTKPHGPTISIDTSGCVE